MSDGGRVRFTVTTLRACLGAAASVLLVGGFGPAAPAASPAGVVGRDAPTSGAMDPEDPYSTTPPPTPTMTVGKPGRVERGKGLVVWGSVRTKGNVELAQVDIEATDGRDTFSSDEEFGSVYLGPGRWEVTTSVRYRTFTDTQEETRVVAVPRPPGVYDDLQCTITGPVEGYNYDDRQKKFIGAAIPFRCTDEAWLGDLVGLMNALAVYDSSGAVTGWTNPSWDPDHYTIPYVPELADLSAAEPEGRIPVGYEFVADIGTSNAVSSFHHEETIPVWVPADRVDGPWQTETRIDTVRIARPPTVHHPQPDDRVCASRTDLWWVKTDGRSMGPGRVARILGNHGVEVDSDWVDITRDGVPDVYQRTRWYAGCESGWVAEVRFWGTERPNAAKKRMLRP